MPVETILDLGGEPDEEASREIGETARPPPEELLVDRDGESGRLLGFGGEVVRAADVA